MPETSDARILELAAQIVTHARNSLCTHLEIGRVLATEFYENDPMKYRCRGKKAHGLREIERLLRTNYDMPRSFCSIGRLIAVHFQEPELNLTPKEKFCLSWTSRSALLRVYSPEEKSKWAHDAIKNHWSTRELLRRIRAAFPTERSKFPHEKCFKRLIKKMEMELAAWTNAPPGQAEGILAKLALLKRLTAVPQSTVGGVYAPWERGRPRPPMMPPPAVCTRSRTEKPKN